MEKHTNVPAAAAWNADNNEWEYIEVIYLLSPICCRHIE